MRSTPSTASSAISAISACASSPQAWKRRTGIRSRGIRLLRARAHVCIPHARRPAPRLPTRLHGHNITPRRAQDDVPPAESASAAASPRESSSPGPGGSPETKMEITPVVSRPVSWCTRLSTFTTPYTPSRSMANELVGTRSVLAVRVVAPTRPSIRGRAGCRCERQAVVLARRDGSGVVDVSSRVGQLR